MAKKTIRTSPIMSNKHATLLEMLGYGTGYFGYGYVTQMMTSYLVFYATAILILPGSLVGLILSISIVWDAVSDPLMGFISDRTHSKFGKRHLFIFLGTISTAVINLLVWTVPLGASVISKFIWLLTSVMLVKTAITIFITPYNALGAELTTDYHKRSTVQAIKTIFFLSALVVVNAVCMLLFFTPTEAYPIGQLNPMAYRNIAITSSLLMLLTGFMAAMTTKRFKKTSSDHLDDTPHVFLSFISKIKYCMSDPDYKQIFWGYMFTNLASAIISVVGLHTFTYTFSMNNYQIGLVFALQFLVSILSQPMWLKLASIMDKKKAVLLGLVISIFACLLLFLFVVFRTAIVRHYQYLFVYATIVGFGTSGLFSLPLSMIADTVDHQEYKTYERNEGVYFGFLNLGYKMSQALAILLLGVALDLIKFNPNVMIQSNQTMLHLGSLLSLGSLISFVFAGFAYARYSLDQQSILRMQAEIRNRSSLKSKGGHS